MNKSITVHPSFQFLLILSIVVVFILTACSRGSSTTASTNAPLPTNTSKPTNPPAPTNTPKPNPTSPPVNSPNPIQNIVWQWISVTNQTTRKSTTVPDPASYTITFYPDGTLTGKADCNTFDGTYSQKRDFTINLGASSMVYCGEASLDQQYTQLLGNIVAGGPDGAGNLALETAGGEQRMLFKNGGPASK
jgi:heat shock protein HslJ